MPSPTPTTDRPDETPAGAGRRAVLLGGGAAVALAGLAACSPGGGGAVAGPTHTGPVQLGPTTDVPVGGGKIYTDIGVVVTQPAAGTFKCFSAVCTHASCLVTNVVDGTITCPCHHSAFHIADGTVARGPAALPLTAEEITVSDGTITLSA
jgi:Rieske Fe-S protein